MKPKPIGILGGAGPLAGSMLIERLFTLSGSLYGCHKDADFPEVMLLSYPFSEMLSPQTDATQVRKELKKCLKQLRNNGAAVLAIACNTLHAFLDEDEDQTDLIHLPKSIVMEVPPSTIPLVLCTSTSVKFALHRQYFPCTYPNSRTQKEIDNLIEQILRWGKQEVIIQKLQKILDEQTESTVILGCTELSLYSKDLPPCDKVIIDPLEIIAKKILETSF